MNRHIFGSLYRFFLKPVFFLCNAEKIHELITGMGGRLGQIALGRILIRKLFFFEDASLHRRKDGILFPNPVGLSAGFDYQAQLPEILTEVGFGFVTVGTITLHPSKGNPSPRLRRLPRSQSLLVNKGFKNPGAAEVIKRLSTRKFKIPVGISIGSTNKIFSSLSEQIDDILQSFRLFENSQVHHVYYELNISCPNTQGGQPFTTPERLAELLTAVDKLHISRPIYLKMPIDFTKSKTLQLLETAKAHQIQGVIFGNLTKDKTNPAVHPLDRAVWEKSAGHLSGKPTWERSNALIQLTKKTFGSRFTIIGTGGIFSPEDAQHKLELGADLVQLITGMIYQGPQLIGEINEHLAVSKHR